jgi:hypothetical protein
MMGSDPKVHSVDSVIAASVIIRVRPISFGVNTFGANNKMLKAPRAKPAEMINVDCILCFCITPMIKFGNAKRI